MNSEELLDECLDISNDILYQDPIVLKWYHETLQKNIVSWALENSGIYSKFYEPNRIFTKHDLLNKEEWYVGHLQKDSVISNTSGSSTGDLLIQQPGFSVTK